MKDNEKVTVWSCTEVSVGRVRVDSHEVTDGGGGWWLMVERGPSGFHECLYRENVAATRKGVLELALGKVTQRRNEGAEMVEKDNARIEALRVLLKSETEGGS